MPFRNKPVPAVRVRSRSVVCIDRHAGGEGPDREWVAHATWRVEVAFFDEPGGMMDQVMCAMGGVRTVDFILRSRRIPLLVLQASGC